MNFEQLPTDEPGSPLIRTKPGFMDELMQRVGEIDRRRARKRATVRVLTVAAVGIAIATLVTRIRTQPDMPVQRATVQFESSPHGDVVVHSIEPSNPLAQAGVRAGDKVTKVGQQPVTDVDHLTKMLKAMDDCKPKEIELVRDNRRTTVTARPGGLGPCRGVVPRQR